MQKIPKGKLQDIWIRMFFHPAVTINERNLYGNIIAIDTPAYSYKG